MEKLKQLGRNLQAPLEKLEQLKENINQFLAEAESAEFVLNETIVDMKKRLSEAKQLVATAIAEEQRLLNIYWNTIDTVRTWGDKADVALRNGDMAGAREALQRQHQQKQLANRYKDRLAEQKEMVARLKTALQAFYQQFQSGQTRAEFLHQQQKQAETRAALYKLLAEFNEHSGVPAFEQAARKLDATQAKAEMWEERNRSAVTHIEKTRDGFNLDEALAALKRDILDNSRK